jgi:hypothetical protein
MPGSGELIALPPAWRSRIAELSDGKRALWSMLSVQQKQKQKPPERGADPTTVQGLASGVVGAESEGSLLAREEAVVRAEAALSKLKTAHAESVAMQEAQLARREEAVQQAEERIIAKEAIAAQRMASVARGEAELQAAKLALADLEAGVAAREEQLARAEAVLHKVRCHHRTELGSLTCVVPGGDSKFDRPIPIGQLESPGAGGSRLRDEERHRRQSAAARSRVRQRAAQV